MHDAPQQQISTAPPSNRPQLPAAPTSTEDHGRLLSVLHQPQNCSAVTMSKRQKHAALGRPSASARVSGERCSSVNFKSERSAAFSREDNKLL